MDRLERGSPHTKITPVSPVTSSERNRVEFYFFTGNRYMLRSLFQNILQAKPSQTFVKEEPCDTWCQLKGGGNVSGFTSVLFVYVVIYCWALVLQYCVFTLHFKLYILCEFVKKFPNLWKQNNLFSLFDFLYCFIFGIVITSSCVISCRCGFGCSLCCRVVWTDFLRFAIIIYRSYTIWCAHNNVPFVFESA